MMETWLEYSLVYKKCDGTDSNISINVELLEVFEHEARCRDVDTKEPDGLKD